MDNLDHVENTLPGVDFLKFYWKNDSKKGQPGYIQMLPESWNKMLYHILPCQLLIRAKVHGKRGEIPETFITFTTSFTDTFKIFSQKCRSIESVWSS